MAGGITSITSSTQFNSQLSTHIYVIADFYADWCGPCKAIAPTFASLAGQHALAGKLAFVKVDVDAHPDIAQKYGVSAMPTFLVLRNGAVKDTIRGANPAALKGAVTAAAAEVKGAAPKSSQVFQSTGRTLGSSSTASRQASGRSGFESFVRGVQVGMGSQTGRGGLVEMIVRFLGLYFTTLFSLDVNAAAEASPFNVKNKRR